MARSQCSLRMLASGLLLASSGCAALQVPTTEVASTHPLAEPISLIYRVEGQEASRLAIGSTEHGGAAGKTRVLSLKFPHPKSKPGYGRVELIVESPSEQPVSRLRAFASKVEELLPGVRMGEGIEGAWTLDVPEKDLRQIMQEIESQGFFTTMANATDDRVLMAVGRRGETNARSWHPVPSLDRLAQRVRSKGKVVGHSGDSESLAAMLREAALNNVRATGQTHATPQTAMIERLPRVWD